MRTIASSRLGKLRPFPCSRRVFLAIPALVAALALSPTAASAASALSFPLSLYHPTQTCADPVPGSVSCLALRLVSDKLTAQELQVTQAQDEQDLRHGVAPSVADSSPAVGSYSPADLKNAYDLPNETTAAKTQTIALIDAYDAPEVESDLNIYSQQYGLPSCTSANGCFQKVNEEGEGAPLPPASGAWAAEESLDVEMAHGVCPQCRIMLVESSSEQFSDIETAVRTAVKLGATEISNSYGGEEESGLAGDESYNHPEVVITAATGDYGYDNWTAALVGYEGFRGTAPDFPASSPDVVAVGGTTLTKNGGSWESTVWNGLSDANEQLSGTGGGCSTLFNAQPWQISVPDWSETGCDSSRLGADISAVADPSTGVSVYDSYPDGQGDPTGWTVYGGTSVSSPIVAAEYALAGGSQGVEYPAQTLYENASKDPADVYDVTKGRNDPLETNCTIQLACNAGPGYDGPSGLGSPIGLNIFSAPAPATVAPAVLRVPNVADNSSEHYQVGDTIVTSNGSWVGSPAPSYVYQWQRCNSAGEDCVDIGGATSPSYVLTGGDIGTHVRSVITAENTGGVGHSDSSVSPLVIPQVVVAPSNTSLPVVTDSSSSNYRVGDALSATHGGWSSAASYSYQWERCATSGGSCSAIAGATNPAYTLTSSDSEFTAKVVVTATDSGGSNSAASLATQEITTTPSSSPSPPVSLPPVNTSAPLALGSAVVGSTLSANRGGWRSVDAPTYTYQWVDCRPGAIPSSSNCAFVLSGGTDSSYQVKASDVGNTLAVLVTATNSVGSSVVYSGATIVVTAPPSSSPEGAATLSSRVLSVLSSGKRHTAMSTLSCQGSGCHGTLLLQYRSGHRLLKGGEASYDISSGKLTAVKITLSSSLAKVLRSHHSLAATLTMQLGSGVVHNYVVTLRAKS